jgi:diguanylate cyclase (GGDEF)-like protein
MIEFKGFSRDDFEYDLQNEISRNGVVPNLLITDIRDFSKVNATVGSNNSDAFLKRLFNILKDTLPGYVNLYSYGGDQFVATLDIDAPENAVNAVAEQIKKLCSTPVMVSGVTFTIDVWIGIRYTTAEPISFLQIINELMTNLNKVKNAVYDLVQVPYEQESHEFSNVTPLNSAANSKYNLARIHQVTSGIKLGAVLPYAQSIVDGNGQIVGYEILARMIHKNELDLPDRFMPIIRSRSLMTIFTKEIFTKVLESLNRFSKPDDTASIRLFMSFNVDFETMADSSCCDHIKSIASQLQRYGYETKLEISEESIADDPDEVNRVFDNYKSVGIQLSIDDFGTINSNFHRVRSLTFAEIKVDKSFGISCLTDKASALFVSFTKEFAVIKKAVCVVEGVETEEQFTFLKKLGINRFQGYYFSKPQPLKFILETNDTEPSKIRKF